MQGWVTGDLISLTGLIIFDTLCVKVGTPPLAHFHALRSVLRLVCGRLSFSKALSSQVNYSFLRMPSCHFFFIVCFLINMGSCWLLCFGSSLWFLGEKVVHKRNSWFRDHLLVFSQVQHSSEIYTHLCLAGHTSIQTAGTVVLKAIRNSYPVT